MIDLSNAPQQRDPDLLIPHGTLCWGVFKIRPANLDAGQIETVSKNNSNNAYLDCEITVEGGAFDKKKVWTRIGVRGGDAYLAMGKAAMRAIVEVGRGASPQNMDAYKFDNYMALDGLKCAVRVKEDHQAGYMPKNDIGLWLTPLDPAAEKEFARLMAGDTSPNPHIRKPVIKQSNGGAATPGVSASAAWGGAVPMQQVGHGQPMQQDAQTGGAVPTTQTAEPAPGLTTPPWLQKPPADAQS